MAAAAAGAEVTSVSVDVAAPAEVVWALVSDLTRMGEWSPETTKVEWTKGSTGPSVGATFRGYNKLGPRRWFTDGTIVVADPPRELAWDVAAVRLPVARWRYLIESTGELSCRVTEVFEDRRGGIVKVLGNLVSGVKDRGDHNAKGMQATLDRIKAAAEPD